VLFPLVAGVQVAEIFFKAFVERYVNIVLIPQILPLLYNFSDGVGRQELLVFRKENKQKTVEQLLGFFKETEFVVIRVVFYNALENGIFKCGVVGIELFSHLLILSERRLFDGFGKAFAEVSLFQAEPENFKLLFGQLKKVKLYVFYSVINVESEFFEIGDHYIIGVAMIIFVVKCLLFYFIEIGGVSAF